MSVFLYNEMFRLKGKQKEEEEDVKTTPGILAAY